MATRSRHRPSMRTVARPSLCVAQPVMGRYHSPRLTLQKRVQSHRPEAEVQSGGAGHGVSGEDPSWAAEVSPCRGLLAEGPGAPWAFDRDTDPPHQGSTLTTPSPPRRYLLTPHLRELAIHHVSFGGTFQRAHTRL